MNNNLKKISISKLFFDNNYLVPIYQRNYAWEEKHIEQLIDDINDFKDSENDYFLGNLIVNQRESNLFEVIDGQQRLTTLYLLQKNLGISLPKESLLFEAREKSNQTLSHLNRDNNIINNDLDSSEIIEGYKIINNYFEVNGLKKEEIRNKLKKVFLIRIQVPKNIDLNHYFEIMNTRGEQLELHEIAKARILNELKKDDDIKVAALIWEKCSEMNSYVQMNFPKYLRKYLFNEDWSCISDSIVNFDSIVNKIKDADEKEFEKQKKNKTEKILEIEYSKMSLRKILIENKTTIKINNEFDEENRRFESIISFPNFLLHISTILNPSDKEDSNLDDNHFLNNISKAWLNQDSAKYFLYHLLKCRVLFDSFIIKREYVSEDKETVNWSLQRLVKYKDKKENEKPDYKSTFKEQEENNKLKTLQSCLRITYTSPKTMHWITEVLYTLLKNEEPNIFDVLEEYCKKKVKESDYKNKKGFQINRIVFSYLDYLIYRDGYSFEGMEIIPKFQKGWEFQFRNSIEHFYPQKPAEEELWEKIDLDGFGNLALLTVSGNSKFSNLLPESKVKSYSKIVKQSLKLKIMDSMIDNGNLKWTKEMAKLHQDEMFKILDGC